MMEDFYILDIGIIRIYNQDPLRSDCEYLFHCMDVFGQSMGTVFRQNDQETRPESTTINQGSSMFKRSTVWNIPNYKWI